MNKLTSTLVVLLALGISPCKSVFADETATNAPIAQLRVIWKEAPQTKATLSWSTPVAGKKHRVYYDTKSCKGDVRKYKRSGDTHRNAAYSGSENRSWYHHALLTDLKPDTTYYFTVQSDDHTSPEYHFDTASHDDRDFKMIAGGDSRSNSGQRRIMNGMIRDLHDKDPLIKAFAHGGDFVQNGRSWNQWDRWLTDHTLTIGRNGRALPIIPTRGNHDGGPLFNEIFDFPAEDKNYYVTPLNRVTTLITLNTETSAMGDQMTFLKEALKENVKSKWLLAQYHKPAFPAVKQPGPSRAWVGLFEAYQMDVLIESDGHNIKRTVPIKDGKRDDKQGLVYVGEGGLGVGQRTPKPDLWYLQSPGMAGRGHHLMLFSFGSKSIEYKVILSDQSIKDTYSFKKRTRKTPAPETIRAALIPPVKKAPATAPVKKDSKPTPK